MALSQLLGVILPNALTGNGVGNGSGCGSGGSPLLSDNGVTVLGGGLD